jgi:hypothetical protein
VFGRVGAVVAANGDYTAAQVTNAESTLNKNINGGYVGRDATGNAVVPGSITAKAFISSNTTNTTLITMIPGANTNFASPISMGLWGLYLDSTNGNKLTRQDSSGNKILIEGGAGGGAVTSVFGRTGAVVAATGDYTAAQVTNAESTLNKNTNGGYVGRDTSGNVVIPGTITAAGFISSNTTNTSLISMIPGPNTNFASTVAAGNWGLFLNAANGNKLTRQDSSGNQVVIEGAATGLSDPGANGLVARTAVNTTAARTLAAGSSQVVIANGSGAAGNPTVDLAATITASTTGTSANVTGIVAAVNGGTGAANTVGAAGHYLRSNGTAYVDSAILVADVANAESTLNKNTNGGYVGRDASGNVVIPGTITAAGFISSNTTNTSLITMLPGPNTNFASTIPAGDWGLFLDSANGNKLTRQNATGTQVVIEGAASGLGDPGANGLVARTALNTTASRTLTAGSTQVVITNGSGAAGNPTIDLGIVTAVSGGTGAANTVGAAGHYLRSNGTSYIDNTIQLADIPAAQRVRICQAGVGMTGTGSTASLPSGTTYILSGECRNNFGSTFTITGIGCYNDAGAATGNVADNLGNPLLTGAITGGAGSFTAGTQSATTTIASGNWMNFTFTGDGTTRQITCNVTGTL